MNQSTINALKTIGLNEKEAAVYLAILQMKKGTTLTIAKAAHLKRPTTYGVLEALIEKKLIVQTKFRNVRDYRALSPEHLKKYVRAQEQLAERELPHIKELYEARPVKLRLRTWEGIPAVKTLLEKMLGEKGALHILGNQKCLAEALNDFWDFFLKRSQQFGMAPRFKTCSSTMAMFLWSDKVAFIDLAENVQSFGFKNRSLHDMYEKIWKNF